MTLLEQAEAAVVATTNDENRQPRALLPPASKLPAPAPACRRRRRRRPLPRATPTSGCSGQGRGARGPDAVRGCAVRVKNKAEYAVGVVLDVTAEEEPALTLDFGGRRERVPLRFASGSRFTDDEAATYRRRRERAGLAPLARAAWRRARARSGGATRGGATTSTRDGRRRASTSSTARAAVRGRGCPVGGAEPAECRVENHRPPAQNPQISTTPS